MDPAQCTLLAANGNAPILLPNGTGVTASKETVGLNNLIAGAVKQTAAAGQIMLRMDELPGVAVHAAALQEAFVLLFRCLLSLNASSGKTYCYVKGTPAVLSLFDRQKSQQAYKIEIHSNVQEGNGVAIRNLLLQATGLFAQNNIGLEQKEMPAGGVLFALTLFGCIPSSG